MKTECWIRKLGAILMAFLGFPSCSKSTFEPEESSNPFIAAYGVPTANYQVKGTVRNEAGTFSRAMSTYPDDYVQISYNDIDGPAHGGEYQSMTVTVKVTKLGDCKSVWDHGTYKAESTVNLKKK